MIGSTLFYFGISLFTALLAWLSIVVDKKSQKFVEFVSLFVPSFFAGIRYGIGTDYFVTYEPYFNYLSGNGAFQLTNRSGLDIGYTAINWIIIKLGGGFHLVLFICSFITFVFLRKAILVYKDKLNIGLATFIFMLLYYQASFNIVRQIMAATIVLFAFRYIQEKKIKNFIAWIIVAALFHKTAIIVIPFYFLINFVAKTKWKIVSVAIYCAFFLIVFNFDKFAFLANLIDSSGYYSAYFRKVSGFRLSLGLIIRTVPYAIVAVLMWKTIKNDITVRIYASSFLMGGILRLIVYMTQFDADRIAVYFLMSQVIFIPCLAKQWNKGWKNFFAVMMLILTTVALWYFDFIYMGRNSTIPYQSIF